MAEVIWRGCLSILINKSYRLVYRADESSTEKKILILLYYMCWIRAVIRSPLLKESWILSQTAACRT